MGFRHDGSLLVTYGPPPFGKRRMRLAEWSAHMYTAFDWRMTYWPGWNALRVHRASARIGDLDAPAILNFLDHVEQQRKNQIQSRNVRLAAIRSFFRLVALRDPASVHIVTRVLAIPLKRADKRLVGYLTRAEMDAILDVPDRKTWGGQRDYMRVRKPLTSTLKRTSKPRSKPFRT